MDRERPSPKSIGRYAGGTPLGYTPPPLVAIGSQKKSPAGAGQLLLGYPTNGVTRKEIVE